jgi:hypothetical protein
MLLKQRQIEPRVFMIVGTLLTAVANIFHRYFPATERLGEGWSDALYGGMFGLGIGMSLLSIWMITRNRRRS